ncbi:hypothetical protein ASF41_22100 [Methylobacterium sp. Leaf111]|uniref:hypothetical protein n=1 Tax=Methylobacterium sp. Leaf111 TaxID=1736257 RepID=UPI0006FC70C1|nr:hypothetical protein [Methylobacterium sp. Leaf111]KQP64053.1 hypothetical protein ASF41_22100 [Methylobacterium sp. Leaf111]
MDEDLIVLGAPAETPAAGGEVSDATEAPGGPQAEGGEVVQPGTEQADPANPTPKPDAPKGEGEEEGEAEKPKKRSGIQRMQERIARLEAEKADLLSRSAPTGDSGDRKAAVEKEIGAPPKEADFEDYAAFEDAKADYRLAKALAEQRLNERDAHASRAQSQAREAAIEAFHDRMDDAREKISDFDTVVKGAAEREIKPHVQELVVDSEKGGLLTYYLAKNPAELTKLNGMSPLQAAKAVGALEARLTLAKPNKATAAPAPAKPVTGSAAPGPDPSKMSFAEYEKWRAGKR